MRYNGTMIRTKNLSEMDIQSKNEKIYKFNITVLTERGEGDFYEHCTEPKYDKHTGCYRFVTLCGQTNVIINTAKIKTIIIELNPESVKDTSNWFPFTDPDEL